MEEGEEKKVEVRNKKPVQVFSLFVNKGWTNCFCTEGSKQ